MKKTFYQLLVCFVVFAALTLNSGCKTKGCTDKSACNYNSEATKDDGTCNYGCNGGGGGGSSTGNVTFWNNDSNVGIITVYMGGTSNQISSNTYPTSCNTSGCANFSGSPGSYSFTASATTGETWSGTVVVTSNGCLLEHLN